jgi:hypothetical protein
MRSRHALATGLAAIVLFVSAGAGAQPDLVGYDPAADPFEQVRNAGVTAAADSKLILVVAGGEWCIWCHYLDAFLTENADIGKALKETFVVVKAYLGETNMNEAFFSTLPEALGYPHFWVLAADGTLIASEGTLPLEDGDKSYDAAKFSAFVDKWAATVAH